MTKFPHPFGCGNFAFFAPPPAYVCSLRVKLKVIGQNDPTDIEGHSMSAPWKKNKTTLEKVEERFYDIVDQLKLDERAADLKTQIKDLKLDERAIDLKDQIAASDAFNDLKDASSQGLTDLKGKVSSTPEPKPKKGRKILLLAVLGSAAAAVAYARKAGSSSSKTPPFSPPTTYTPPKAAPNTSPSTSSTSTTPTPKDVKPNGVTPGDAVKPDDTKAAGTHADKPRP